MDNATSTKEAGKWGDSPLLFAQPSHGKYFANIAFKKEMDEKRAKQGLAPYVPGGKNVPLKSMEPAGEDDDK